MNEDFRFWEFILAFSFFLMSLVPHIPRLTIRRLFFSYLSRALALLGRNELDKWRHSLSSFAMGAKEEPSWKNG
jgi:hypothetical protein